MLRPTLSDFRREWPADATGICQADPQVIFCCNQAQRRLLIDPFTPDEGWYGGTVTLILTASIVNNSAYVTTPREIGRLTDFAVCQHPVQMRNRFYEYLNFGRGLQPKTCHSSNCGQKFQVYDRDNVPTLAPLLATPQTIRIYPSDPRDSGLRVLIQGIDKNNMPVLCTDPNTGLTALGEYVSLKFPFVDSLNQYSSITGLLKDDTFGPIQFFQTDPVTGVEMPLSSMEPTESAASYRRYLVSSIPNLNVCCYSPANPLRVTAQGRLDFIPVANENDFLTIQNIDALLEEVQSLRYRRMDGGANQALLHHRAAIELLVGQLDANEGKVSTAVNVPIFGSQRLRRQVV